MRVLVCIWWLLCFSVSSAMEHLDKLGEKHSLVSMSKFKVINKTEEAVLLLLFDNCSRYYFLPPHAKRKCFSSDNFLQIAMMVSRGIYIPMNDDGHVKQEHDFETEITAKVIFKQKTEARLEPGSYEIVMDKQGGLKLNKLSKMRRIFS